jgi:hypothetical protein
MLLFELIAEQKIREAIERGELDHLPGQGRPLDLTDDRLVPEELRKLQLLRASVAESRRGREDLRLEADYCDRLIERFSKN